MATATSISASNPQEVDVSADANEKPKPPLKRHGSFTLIRPHSNSTDSFSNAEGFLSPLRRRNTTDSKFGAGAVAPPSPSSSGSTLRRYNSLQKLRAKLVRRVSDKRSKHQHDQGDDMPPATIGDFVSYEEDNTNTNKTFTGTPAPGSPLLPVLDYMPWMSSRNLDQFDDDDDDDEDNKDSERRRSGCGQVK
jgi:hypothetical protein